MKDQGTLLVLEQMAKNGDDFGPAVIRQTAINALEMLRESAAYAERIEAAAEKMFAALDNLPAPHEEFTIDDAEAAFAAIAAYRAALAKNPNLSMEAVTVRDSARNIEPTGTQGAASTNSTPLEISTNDHGSDHAGEPWGRCTECGEHHFLRDPCGNRTSQGESA